MSLFAKASHTLLKLSAKNPAEKLKKAEFDLVSPKEGSCYCAGFGKALFLPEDIKKKRYYIAGYGENNPARGVIDPQYAHALWLEDGSGGGHLFLSLDIVGLLNKDVNSLRGELRELLGAENCKSICILSTHNHAGIDTMGIWGLLPLSGKDGGFMRLMFDAAKKAALEAYSTKKSGKLYLGTVQVPDMQEDIRTPVVFSKTLTRLRFHPNEGGNDIYFINFASHSESLQGSNSLVSADFPCYLREKIKKEAGADTVYGVGAIGGMISMRVEDCSARCRQGRILESTRDIGYRLADYALSVKDEKELAPSISYTRQELYCPAENPVLTLACKIGILSADRYWLKETGLPALKTELSYYEIGGQKLLMLPGEVFPELVYGCYLGSEESATGLGAEANPVPLAEIAKDEGLLVFGLANDEIGYVIPPNDFLLNTEKPFLDRALDRFGRKHYEETNSMGIGTAHTLARVFSDMMDEINKTKQEAAK